MVMSGGYSGTIPTLGARVVTADGDELGKVKEVSGTCFKVDASMQPDYWLGSDCVTSSTGAEVRLSIRKDQVGDAKVDGPDHSGVHRHTA
jgi:rRNA processing protein Gar1